MKACAAQRSANLQFVEQMEKHTSRHVMLKHKEFEFIILGIVSLIISLTSRNYHVHILYCLCISVNTNKDQCVT